MERPALRFPNGIRSAAATAAVVRERRGRGTGDETFTGRSCSNGRSTANSTRRRRPTNLRGRVFRSSTARVRSERRSEPGWNRGGLRLQGQPAPWLAAAHQAPSGPNKATVDWTAIDKLLPDGELTPAQLAALEQALDTPLRARIFETSGTYDALNRPLTSTAPDGSVSTPTYNEANLLETLGVNLRGAAAPDDVRPEHRLRRQGPADAHRGRREDGRRRRRDDRLHVRSGDVSTDEPHDQRAFLRRAISRTRSSKTRPRFKR